MNVRSVDCGVLIRTSHYIERCCDKGGSGGGGGVSHYDIKVTLHSHRSGGKIISENYGTAANRNGDIDEWLGDELFKTEFQEDERFHCLPLRYDTRWLPNISQEHATPNDDGFTLKCCQPPTTLTKPTSDGRSFGIVRLRTKATELVTYQTTLHHVVKLHSMDVSMYI
jgi:hypothetical protein